MSKKILLAILLVYISGAVMDYVIHQVILMDSYDATAHFWRPMEEMKMGLMQVVSIIASTSFVLIFALWFKEKNAVSGLKYGLLFGIGVGVGMGYGMYSVMPIPYHMALTWFLGTIVDLGIAGLLAGWALKDAGAASSTAE